MKLILSLLPILLSASHSANVSYVFTCTYSFVTNTTAETSLMINDIPITGNFTQTYFQQALNLTAQYGGQLETLLKNQSGEHTLQQRHSCDPSTDKWSWTIARDGNLSYVYDQDNASWTGTDSVLSSFATEWKTNNETNRTLYTYLSTTCAVNLNSFAGNESGSLPAPREPVVIVTASAADGGSRETHTCRAFGFYPKEIELDWMKDEEVESSDVKRSSIKPNADHTYNGEISLDIDWGARPRYKCRVGHDSFNGYRNYTFNPGASATGAVVGFLLTTLIMLVACLVYYRRNPMRFRHLVAGLPV